MDRLTEWYDDGQQKGILVKEYPTESSIKTLYQKFGERSDYFDCEEGYLGMEKLKTYEDAEEQGLLLRLPCKIGGTVWDIKYGHIRESVVSRYDTAETLPRGAVVKAHIHVRINGFHNRFLVDDFGKTVFLTKEEAEQALKQMGE